MWRRERLWWACCVLRVKALLPYQETEYWGVGVGLIRGIPVFATCCCVELIPRPIVKRGVV